MMISIKSTEKTLSSIMDLYFESQRAAMNITNNFASQTDVLLIMNDGIIPVHAVILQAVSPFFEAIFASQGPNYVGMREVLLPDFSVSIMSSVVKLIYSQEVYLKNEKEATEVRQTMNSFGLRESEIVSVNLCERFSNQENRQSTNNKVDAKISVYNKSTASKSESRSCGVQINKLNTNLIATGQEINHTSCTGMPNAKGVSKKSQKQSSSMSCRSRSPTKSVHQQKTLNNNIANKCLSSDSVVVDKAESSGPVVKPSNKNPLSRQQPHFNASTKQPPSKRIKLIEDQFTKEKLKTLKDCVVRPHQKDGKTYVFVFRKKERNSKGI